MRVRAHDREEPFEEEEDEEKRVGVYSESYSVYGAVQLFKTCYITVRVVALGYSQLHKNA